MAAGFLGCSRPSLIEAARQDTRKVDTTAFLGCSRRSLIEARW